MNSKMLNDIVMVLGKSPVEKAAKSYYMANHQGRFNSTERKTYK
jgi:hypothetical protein